LQKFSIISGYEKFLANFFSFFWYAMPTFVPKFDKKFLPKKIFAEIIGYFSLKNLRLSS